MMNQTQVRIHPLEAGILSLEFFDSGQLTYTESSILGFPVIKGRIADTVVSTDVSNLQPLLLFIDRKRTRLNCSHVAISYAVVCVEKKSNEQIAFVSVENVYTAD